MKPAPGECHAGLRVLHLDELAPYAQQWDRLAARRALSELDLAFALVAALRPRCDLARPPPRLMVLGVFDQADTLVGVAPWYMESSGPRGDVIRWLGSGEVCSDYVSILCHPAAECQVVETIADYLAETLSETAGGGPAWDLLELGSVNAEDHVADGLIRRLAEHGNRVHQRPALSCWRV